MKLDNIEFDKEEELKEITVTMSIDEACWMAKMTGSITNVNSKLHSEIYSCLTGAFFNKFYCDGVNEAQRKLGVVMPEIADLRLGDDK